MKEFDEFDNIEVPDRWNEIVARAETAASSGPSSDVGRRSRVLVLLGAAAAVVAMLAGFLVMNRMSQDVVVSPVTEPSVSDPLAPDPSTTQSPSTAVPTTEPFAPASAECASESDLGAIGDLFRTGQPTYDYTPARDVAELIEKSAVVVTGTIAGVQRQQGGRETYTVFDVEDVEVLAGSGEVESFVTSSVWPFLDEPDPLADRIELDGVRFVAFLEPLGLNSAPSRWQPNVEGFAFGCGDLPAESPAGLPPDAQGLPVDGVVELVESSIEPEGIMRPVFPPEVCDATFARGNGLPLTDDVTFFARPSDNPIAIQIIGTKETTPAEPFAWVQRSFGDNRDVRELRVLDNGNGDASWDVGDGSQGYIRTRGLDEAQVREIMNALTPMPADAEFPGFVVDSDVWQSLHEAMNTGLTGTGARSGCQVQNVEPEIAGVTLQYTVFVVNGDPVLRYGAVIDRPVPLDVAVLGDSVIIVSGFDDPAAPNAADVIEADPDTWASLLGQPDEMQVFGERIEQVGEGDDVVVELRNLTDIEIEASALTLRVVVEEGVSFLEVDFTDVVLHPDAEFDSFLIDGRLRSESTVTAGSVGGVRISETSPADPFDVSVRITSADGDVLQVTDPIRLVPE
jgi:hypothetical protein